MLKIHQELNQFARIMLTKQQKEFLTSSERELLAWIYLTHNNCTPLYLSKVSGMKKEAVSRCLKSLYTKDCIQRQKNSIDERSYSIYLTENGRNAPKNDFEIMLQKFYDILQLDPQITKKTYQTKLYISTKNKIHHRYVLTFFTYCFICNYLYLNTIFIIQKRKYTYG